MVKMVEKCKPITELHLGDIVVRDGTTYIIISQNIVLNLNGARWGIDLNTGKLKKFNIDEPDVTVISGEVKVCSDYVYISEAPIHPVEGVRCGTYFMYLSDDGEKQNNDVPKKGELCLRCDASEIDEDLCIGINMCTGKAFIIHQGVNVFYLCNPVVTIERF